jgi:hypothetical protein
VRTRCFPGILGILYQSIGKYFGISSRVFGCVGCNVLESVGHPKYSTNRRKYVQGSPIEHQHVPFSSCASVVPVLGTTLALQILVGDQVVQHNAMHAYGLTAECKAQDPEEGGPNASLTMTTFMSRDMIP